MTEQQAITELTTRDVFLQVDRRLTSIEGDLRSLDAKLDDKIDGLRSEMNAQIGGLRSEMDAQIGGLRSEMNAQIGGLRSEMDARLHAEIGGLRSETNAGFARVDTRFQGQTNLILVSWLSLMGMLAALFFK